MSTELSISLDPSVSNTGVQSESQADPFRNVYARRRSVWTLASIVAVFTAGMLLHVYHFRYPRIILLSHILGATLLRVVYARNGLTQLHPAKQTVTSSTLSSRLKLRLGMTVATGSNVAALIYSYDAMYIGKHSLWVVMILYLCIDPIEIFDLCLGGQRVLSLARTAVILLSLAAICRFESLLTPYGPKNVSLAVLFTMLARVATHQLFRAGEDLAYKSQSIAFVILAITLSYMSTSEVVDRPFVTVNARILIVLITNVAAGAVAISLGSHPFTDLLLKDRRFSPADTNTLPSPAHLAPVLTGVYGFAFGSLYRDFTVGAPQIIAYCIAWACTLPSYPTNADDLATGRNLSISREEANVHCDVSLPTITGAHQHGLRRVLAETKPHQSTPTRPRVKAYRRFVAVVGAITWLIVVYRSSNPTLFASRSLPVVFDSDYRPRSSVDMVISYYDEAYADLIATVKSVFPTNKPGQVILYNKGDAARNEELSTLLRTCVSPDIQIVIKSRENVGREAETYLTHILDEWERLAKHTIFVQAKIHNLDAAAQRLSDYLHDETGFLSFSWVDSLCKSCENCRDSSDWTEHPSTLEWIYDMAHPMSKMTRRSACHDLVLTYNGQFAVSAKRIRGGGRAIYERLLDALVNPHSLQHTPAYLGSLKRGDEDGMDVPLFGFTIERMWGVIMQCTDAHIADRCPTLWAGSLGVRGRLEDCQCLDAPA